MIHPSLAFVAVALCELLRPAHAQDAGKVDEARVVRGRVVDQTGAPIARADVLATPEATAITDIALATPTAKTDANGRFELRVPADAVVLLTAKGRACAWALPARTLNTRIYAADPLAVDGSVALLDVILPPATELRGRVLAKGGAPIAGATIAAVDLVGDRVPGLGALTSGTVYRSMAKAGADGRFTLLGTFGNAAQLTVQARGYYTRIERPVDRTTPLTLELTPSGMCRGRVVDADGKPVSVDVYANFTEGGRDRPTTRSDVDGKFELPVSHPGTYRVHAFDAATTRSTDSGPLHAPTDTLTLRLAAAAPREFAVRAVDGEGKPVQEFAASVRWMPDNPLLQILASIMPSTRSVDGVARLAKPLPTEPNAGRVTILAKGFARHAAPALWDPEKPELTVTLSAESVAAGKVLDADGKPLRSVRIRVAKPPQTPAGLPAGFEMPSMLRPWTGYGEGEVTTAADGTFRVGELNAGDYELSAWPIDLPAVAPRKLQLAAGEQRLDLEVKVERGVILRGKVEGTKADVPAEVTVHDAARAARAVTSSPTDAPLRRGALAADNEFTIAGLAEGKHALALAVFAHPRALAPVRAPLGVVTLAGAEVTHACKPSPPMQTTLRGTVTVEGAAVPASRLLVLARAASRVDDGIPLPTWPSPARTIVADDGTFALRALGGEQRVEVYDLLTNMKVGEAEDTVAMTETGGSCAIKIVFGKVRVTLRQPDSGAVLVTRLEVRDPLALDARAARIPGLNSRDSLAGVPVQLDQTTVEFEVPVGEVEIRARNEAPMTSPMGTLPLAEARVSVGKDKVAEVKLDVQRPADK